MFLVASLTQTVVVMGYEKVLEYRCQSMKNCTTEYCGVVDKNRTGTVDCIVSYNSLTMSYSGIYLNNNYEPGEAMKGWTVPFDAGTAKRYYEQLVRIKKNQ